MIDALDPQQAAQLVAQRDRAVRSCADLALAFGVPRETPAHDLAMGLRGAFWAAVTLRVVLRRNPGDVEAQNAAKALGAFLLEHWRPPFGVSAETLDKFGVSARDWQGWASIAYVPDEIDVRNKLVELVCWQITARRQQPPRSQRSLFGGNDG